MSQIAMGYIDEEQVTSETLQTLIAETPTAYQSKREYKRIEVPHHPNMQPDDVKEGDRLRIVREFEGKIYRQTGQHFWKVQKIFVQDGITKARLERHEHPRGTAYLETPLTTMCNAFTRI